MGIILSLVKMVWPYAVCLTMGFAAGIRWEKDVRVQEELQWAQETLRVQQENIAVARRWMNQLNDARIENEGLKQQARETTAKLNANLTGLQSDLNAAKRKLAAASPETCNRAALTCFDILGEVERVGGEIAQAADGHARDVRQLMAAWPQEGK